MIYKVLDIPGGTGWVIYLTKLSWKIMKRVIIWHQPKHLVGFIHRWLALGFLNHQLSHPSTFGPVFFLSRNASGTWRSLMTRRRRFFAAHFRSPSFFSSATFFTKAVDDHFQKWPKTKLWKSSTKSVAGMFPRIYLTEKKMNLEENKRKWFQRLPAYLT